MMETNGVIAEPGLEDSPHEICFSRWAPLLKLPRPWEELSEEDKTHYGTMAMSIAEAYQDLYARMEGREEA